MDANDVLDVLRKNEVFSHLSPDELKHLADGTLIRIYRRGTLLFNEGDPAEGLFVILRGRLRIFRSLPDGREHTIEILGPEDLVALVCLFDGGPYPASSESFSDAAVGILRHDLLDDLIRHNPQVSLGFLRVLSLRMRRAHHRTAQMAMLDAHEKVATTLLWLGRRIGTERDGKLAVTLRSRADFAKMIGTTRETVARVLSDFQRHGALELTTTEILLAPDRLEEWVAEREAD